MKLIPVSEYRELRFVGNKKPSVKTIKRWIQSGDLPGKRIGGLYFVNVAEEELMVTNDDVVNSILNDYEG